MVDSATMPDGQAGRLVAEVQAVLDAYEATWNANDYDGLLDFWDRDDPAPFYQAEEEERPATDWPLLLDYMARTRKINELARLRYHDPKIKLCGADGAVAIVQMHWEIKLSFYPKTLGGDCRIIAMLRRRPDGWKFHSYMEGPISPITYVRKLYESQVAPDFPWPP